MKILFEGYQYKNTILDKTLNIRYYTPVNDNEYSTIEFVGYYYDNTKNDAVIILPKVFIESNGLAFGKYKPSNIVEYSDETKEQLRKDGKDKILFDLSTWLYQAILQFKKRQAKSTIIENESTNNIITNLGDSSITQLDIILSLMRFYKENKQLFTYISKLIHSRQHKTHWNKTVLKCNPYINNNVPIYTNVISKRKSIDFNEELIVIFYSVLHHLNQKYGFKTEINQQYELIKGKNFERLIKNGTRKLRSIKGKYFSDKLLELWRLLYIFFERTDSTRHSNNKREEVLLVKNFNIVFEDMIDDLISDNNSEMPKYFKDQLDGKQVDHIYQYQSLIMNDNIYFVGDSKYYKPSNLVGSQAIAKQFTYAKNTIQYNIDLFNNGKLNEPIRYRDELTEGYNITPNFFISALVNPDFDFTKDGLEKDNCNKKTDLQYHYENRLFDRDTLLVQRYNINFLYVLSAYISRNSSLKQTFKNKARKQFRDRMIEYFNENYVFYKVRPNIDIEVFVSKYFKLLNGKMYRPSNMQNSLILAFSATDTSKDIINKISEFDCIYENFRLF